MDPELQAFAIELTKKIIPEIEGIVEVYKRNAEEGLTAYLDFIKRVKPSVEKIVKGLKDPVSIGHISPRLLRDPLSIDLNRMSSDEEEAHIVGYLKAILQLVYCGAKGLEGWQFISTALHEESQNTQNLEKINIISSPVQIVRQEIDNINSFEQLIVREEAKSEKKKELTDVDKTQVQSQKLDDENTAIPFTARLMAYYRAQENKNDHPLIIDPYAERLAGDLTSYVDKHKFVAGKGDYPIVRSYYIEKNLLTPWCNTHEKSQIVLLGAGLDTRAYRFKPLQTNTHTIFEIDFSMINRYKKEILQGEQPLCDLVRISGDISNHDWKSLLMKSGFSNDTPTFWLLEGLVYYINKGVVASLLKKTAEISAENSQIFVDLCVPILMELNFGPFSRYFKWGLEIETVPSFFAEAGWNVSCSFADDFDQGRDVGQRGLIFVHGEREPIANK